MILIGTPAYNSMVHTDYLHTLINLKIKYSIMNIGNESLITRARNKIFSLFVANDLFTHLLFLDADIGIDPNDINKLINHNKDIIGAPVPLKSSSQRKFNFGEIIKEEDNLFTTDKIGTAVLLLSKKLCIDIAKKAEEENNTYYHNMNYSEGTNLSNNLKIYDVFKVGVFNNEYLSEDFYFCKTCRELHYDVFVDRSIQVRHNGILPIQ